MKRISLRGIFDGSFWVFAGLAAASGTACYLVAGPAAFWESFRDDAELFILILPKLAAALLVAGFIQVLLPGQGGPLDRRAVRIAGIGDRKRRRDGDAGRPDDLVPAR